MKVDEICPENVYLTIGIYDFLRKTTVNKLKLVVLVI